MKEEINVLQFIDHKVVLIGRATQELDHGKPFWLCQTFPPLEQVFQPVSFNDQEVFEWFKQFGEVDFIKGVRT